jgi:hypothetical protein
MKIVTAGVTALFMAVSTLAYAQSPRNFCGVCLRVSQVDTGNADGECFGLIQINLANDQMFAFWRPKKGRRSQFAGAFLLTDTAQ